MNYWKLFHKLLDDGVDKTLSEFYLTGLVIKKLVSAGRTAHLYFLQLVMEQGKVESCHHYCLLDI